MLVLICYITFSSSTIDVLVSLYNSLIRSKIEYDSVAWYFIIVTDSYKLEVIQIKFIALCNSRILIGNCSNIKWRHVRLNLPTLQSRRLFLVVLFVISVFKNKLSFQSTFDTVNLRLPTSSIREFSTFDFDHRTKVNPSSRSIPVGNVSNYIDTTLTDIIKYVNSTCNNS